MAPRDAVLPPVPPPAASVDGVPTVVGDPGDFQGGDAGDGNLLEALEIDVLGPTQSDDPFLGTGIRFVPLSGDPLIDGELFDGRAWQSWTLTYSFPDQPTDYEVPYGAYNEPTQPGFAQVSARQMSLVRAVLEGGFPPGGISPYGSVESLTNLDFTFTGYDSADLRFAKTGYRLAPAWTYLPTTNPAGGDVWFVNNVPGYDFSNPVLGDYFYLGHMHEVMHALGLKDSSFDHAATSSGPATPALPTEWDSLEFSIVSYRSFVGAPTTGYRNETYGYPQTPMMLDIAALQYLYGADFTTNAGNTVYRWDPGTGELSIDGHGQGVPGANRVFMTVWDGGGVDTYDLSAYATNLSIDLAPGGYSTLSTAQLAQLNAYLTTEAPNPVFARGNVFNALEYQHDPRSLIENAIGGSGDDLISGNDAANQLSGGAGADTLLGGIGDDSLLGGSGADSMAGGAGNDRYEVDNARDQVVEQPGEGLDTVVSSVSFALPDDVETLILTGTAARTGSGNDLANLIIGGGGADTLDGLGGDDTLDGGAGIDLLRGGSGNDTYLVNAAGDLIQEDAGAGTDTAIATVTYRLAETEIERLVLAAGAGAISGTGNSLDNLLTGNEAANLLQGLGGADTLLGGAGNDSLYGGGGADSLDGGTGADAMAGGTGNDSYAVDSQSDVIYENPGEGTDSVTATASFQLYANIENLTLATASAALFGTGNDLANRITGNEAANVLYGLGGADTLLGGAGNDTLYGGDGADSLDGGAGTNAMAGGTGDDTYVANLQSDVIYENPGEGTDSVTARASFYLYANIENLTLAAGAGALFGSGNELANRMTGNESANALYGLAGADTLLGGAGNDTLYGGEGADSLDGGSGTDAMAGGTGDDSYAVDSQSDVIYENPGEGIDSVVASASFYMYANVENLTLAAGAGALFGSGNELANRMTGNEAANALYGWAGADTLSGGAGNDTLYGGEGNDLFVAAAGTGTDWIGDFLPGADRVRLEGFGIASFAELQPHLLASGPSTLISLGSDAVVLVGVAPALLGAGDFEFA